MSAGFQCFHPDGTLQFDSSSVYCLVLTAKATVEATTLWHQDCVAYYYDIVVTGTTPIVAIRSTGSIYTAIVAVAKSGSTWTFRVLTYGAGSQTFTYYVFDRPSVDAPPDMLLSVTNDLADDDGTTLLQDDDAATQLTDTVVHGLEIYDETGAIVWTSNQKPLRLVFGDDLADLPSGPTYAHISSAFLTQSWSNTTEDGVVFFTEWSISSPMCVCTSTGVTQGGVTLGFGTKSGANNEPRPLGPGINGGGYQNTERLVIDVSNY